MMAWWFSRISRLMWWVHTRFSSTLLAWGGQGGQWGWARGSPRVLPTPCPPYLQAVLLLAVLVVSQAEAERVPRALDQHQ